MSKKSSTKESSDLKTDEQPSPSRTPSQSQIQPPQPQSSPSPCHALSAVNDYLDTYTYVYQSLHPPPTLFDLHFMTTVRLISATLHPPNSTPIATVLWDLDTTPYYANLNGVMHGGAAGVIFDMATTAALCPVQKPGYWDFMGGVTRSLSFGYLRPVPLGTTVRIRCELMQVGRTMALINGFMESLPVDGEEENKKVVYTTCVHHKVNVASLPAHIRLREEMRRKKKDGSWRREMGLAKL